MEEKSKEQFVSIIRNRHSTHNCTSFSINFNNSDHPLISYHMHKESYLGVGSSTGAATPCLDATQVIEQGADKVVMEESTGGWVADQE